MIETFTVEVFLSPSVTEALPAESAATSLSAMVPEALAGEPRE